MMIKSYLKHVTYTQAVNSFSQVLRDFSRTSTKFVDSSIIELLISKFHVQFVELSAKKKCYYILTVINLLNFNLQVSEHSLNQVIQLISLFPQDSFSWRNAFRFRLDSESEKIEDLTAFEAKHLEKIFLVSEKSLDVSHKLCYFFLKHRSILNLEHQIEQLVKKCYASRAFSNQEEKQSFSDLLILFKILSYQSDFPCPDVEVSFPTLFSTLFQLLNELYSNLYRSNEANVQTLLSMKTLLDTIYYSAHTPNNLKALN